MKKTTIAVLAALILPMVLLATEASLPKIDGNNQCYTQVWEAPVFEKKSVTVMIKEAYTETTVTPAVFEKKAIVETKKAKAYWSNTKCKSIKDSSKTVFCPVDEEHKFEYDTTKVISPEKITTISHPALYIKKEYNHATTVGKMVWEKVECQPASAEKSVVIEKPAPAEKSVDAEKSKTDANSTSALLNMYKQLLTA